MEIDESPGDGAGRNFLDEELQSGTGCEAAQEAANRATGTDIDRSNPHCGMRVSGCSDGIDLEFDTLTRTTLRPFDVDDLLIEQVTIKEKLILRRRSQRASRRVRGGVNIRVDGGDGGEGKHAVPGFCFDDERSDAGAVFLRGESDFAHSSGGRAGRVVHRGAEKLGKRQRSHHG